MHGISDQDTGLTHVSSDGPTLHHGLDADTESFWRCSQALPVVDKEFVDKDVGAARSWFCYAVDHIS